jgi:uncharacterized protein YciI
MRLLLTLLVSLGPVSLGVCAQPEAPYVFGFLRAHPQRKELPKEQLMEIQKGHMAHLAKMGEESHLIGAGPLDQSADIRGILIFKGVSLEQARAAAEQDPAVRNERLVVDLAPWPARDGLGEKAIAKLKEGPGAKWSMNKRTIVIYWRTPQFPSDPSDPANREVLDGHRRFREKVEASGELLAVGPLLRSKEFVGLAIYRSPNAAEMLKISDEDPMVRKGWVKAQAFPLFIADEVF